VLRRQGAMQGMWTRCSLACTEAFSPRPVAPSVFVQELVHEAIPLTPGQQPPGSTAGIGAATVVSTGGHGGSVAETEAASGDGGGQTGRTLQDEESLFPSRPIILPDEMKGVLLLPSEVDSDSQSTAGPPEDMLSATSTGAAGGSSPSTPARGPSHTGSSKDGSSLSPENDSFSCSDTVRVAETSSRDPRSLRQVDPVIEVSEVLGAGLPSGLFGGCFAQWDSRRACEGVDFLEVEGRSPLPAASAQWSARLLRAGGVLCPRVPVFFDPSNAGGAEVWGPEACGALVVAERGAATFEEIALNAEVAGAAGLVVVDCTTSASWSRDVEMRQQGEPARKAPPVVPTILVPRCARDFLCDAVATEGLKAAIMRR